MFERKFFVKVKKMICTKAIYNRMFLNVLYLPFIKGFMINLEKHYK